MSEIRECGDKCGWKGEAGEMVKVPYPDFGPDATVAVCPSCSCDIFFAEEE